MGNELVLRDHDFNSAAGQVDQLISCPSRDVERFKVSLQGEPAWRFQR